MRADFRSQFGPNTDRNRVSSYDVLPAVDRIDGPMINSKWTYHYSSNYKGITVKTVFRYVSVAGPIAGALGVAALFYASGIPRVQKDILQKIPLIGPYFVKTTHPADSPF
ncbi:hypothetical protein SPBR_08650 [Sporothrix brasiliensis 5110]|uniref:Uncharacterized protein n=1 Tax=Sporothrix brasiliensis 5110 TaxID=1398154 RepID=A0A0C2IAU5_9PEZI|nr:uncharacterized protein SPBR_08650 [Sporothrix brasiliensis 5110]KIH86376.1 hypothetical protein SPBR_08650 [Sporothrix brasiliensis 5110]